MQTSKYDYIILNSRIQNAFTFVGRDFGQSIPLWNIDLMYYNHAGWYLNTSAFTFFQKDVPLQYTLTAGYRLDLSEQVDLNVSYSQFLVGGESAVAGIQNQGFAQTTIGLDWGVLYSNIQVQALLNESPDIFIQSSHSRYFEFDQLLFKKFVVSFEPKLSFILGTSRFYFLGSYGNLNPAEYPEISSLQFLNWDLNFPISFSTSSWELELWMRYTNPLNLPNFDNSRNRLLFGGGFVYYFPIKRKNK